MKIGVICSSGGGSFRAAYPALSGEGHVFQVLTDRPCGVEEFCRSKELPLERLEESDNRRFSERAFDRFQQSGGVDIVVLFYLRLVTSPLIDRIPCFNIHPSLLPAFRGFHALSAARAARVRFFGATLHLATDSADAGPIIAQVCEPLLLDADDASLAKRSFLHKTYLLFLLIELIERGEISAESEWMPPCGLPATSLANPSLRTPAYIDAVRRIQSTESCVVFA